MFSRTSKTLAVPINRLSQLSQRLIAQPQLAFQQFTRMASTTTAKLNTGATIPALGFGTWQDKDAQEDAVLTALKAGYRHIDTARM